MLKVVLYLVSQKRITTPGVNDYQSLTNVVAENRLLSLKSQLYIIERLTKCRSAIIITTTTTKN
jgi:hypothetical protein